MSHDEHAFHTTQWTQVLSTRGDSDIAREALSDLAERYYAPVVAFLKREGRGEDAARELAHGFFAWLLSRDTFAKLERDRGRFRSYLLGALKHYISHQREHAGLYDRCRIEENEYRRILFEWAWPHIARRCREKKRPYPLLGEEGQMLTNPLTT